MLSYRLSWLALVSFALLGASNVGAADPIGWRTDGTGSYPQAKPPLEWSAEKNVVWKTAMPGMSNSIPVLLGHRLFICTEPCTLMCLHRDDGRILWKKENSYAELEISPADRARLKIEQAETEKLRKQQSEVSREREALRRKLKAEPTQKETIEKELDVLKKRHEALQTEREKLTLAVRYTEPGRQGDAGFSTPTPVTNGKEVFVAFGNGLLACFDLDGNRKWLKLIDHPTSPYAHSSSPVLVGDKVIIHFKDLVALRTKDGSECWRVQRPPTHGTPLATRIGGTDVVATPRGLLVRADDGTILAEGLGECGANSPLLHDGSLFYVRTTATVVRLPDSIKEGLKLKPVWKAKLKGSGYWFPSPVIHDGKIYAPNDQGILTVLDAATGAIVYEQRLELGGTGYPSVSEAGGRIYVSSDNGTTVVIQPGSEYKELARNQLDRFRSSLVFDGKRLYVRTYKYLYCIGE